MAEAGLFDLGYLTSNLDRISAEDMKRAVSVVTALAARSLSLATIYMVNAIFGGAFVAQIASPQQKRNLLPAIREGCAPLGRRTLATQEPPPGRVGSLFAGCLEISQIARRLIFLGGHQQPIPAQEIISLLMTIWALFSAV
jgi:hypothetical protein